MNMRINFDAPNRVRKVMARLGRTEDVKFSPDNRRLAVSGFAKNKLLVLDVEIAVSRDRVEVGLMDYMELTSAGIHEPHGLSFLDDGTLVVANRSGAVAVLQMPSCMAKKKSFVLPAMQTVRGGVFSPGSVAVTRTGSGGYEVLVCNNYAHHVSRHVLDGKPPFDVRSNEVLLSKGLSIPDGVAVNGNGTWIAISNHNAHCVFLYENTPRLDWHSEPEGILNNVEYPHGLRFTSDDKFMLVADAGAPYVHLYEKGADSWKGIRSPSISIRIMDDEVFMKGRHNPQEGGPKGIDIDNNMNVLVTTCEQQILAFFDLQAILKNAEASAASQPAAMPGNPAG
jgi:DNA-binding beta-propeller fold protein YncE